MLIAMRPYFEDVEVLLGFDDDSLAEAYAEMHFFHYFDLLRDSDYVVIEQ